MLILILALFFHPTELTVINKRDCLTIYELRKGDMVDRYLIKPGEQMTHCDTYDAIKVYDGRRCGCEVKPERCARPSKLLDKGFRWHLWGLERDVTRFYILKDKCEQA